MPARRQQHLEPALERERESVLMAALGAKTERRTGAGTSTLQEKDDRGEAKAPQG